MEAAHQDILLQREYGKMFGELEEEKAARAADVRMLPAKIEEEKAARAADVRHLDPLLEHRHRDRAPDLVYTTSPCGRAHLHAKIFCPENPDFCN